MSSLHKTWKRKTPVWNAHKKGLQIAWNKGITGEKSHMTGTKNHQFGKVGILSPNFGKKRSIITRQKMREKALGRVCSEKTRKKMSMSNLKQPRGFAARTMYMNTSIERILEKEFIDMGLIKNKDFYRNYRISNIAKVDFFFPAYNTIVEADGCYYHYCLKCKKGDNNTLKRVEIDRLKTNALKKEGYVVFRFWEHDIKSNVKLLVNKIQIVWQKI